MFLPVFGLSDLLICACVRVTGAILHCVEFSGHLLEAELTVTPVTSCPLHQFKVHVDSILCSHALCGRFLSTAFSALGHVMWCDSPAIQG